ncbi:MAG: hypothetical protein JWN63_3801 [Candidatus Acidoferrum typicum]|jgi:nucleotide-binding universal stress UspA family protein|nr:hypothetical protein [Candidatus Acidoferrum typicum]
MVRPRPELENDMYKNVLIALDASQAAERALHRAIAMAEIDKGDLFVVVVNEGLSLLSLLSGRFQGTSPRS